MFLTLMVVGMAGLAVMAIPAFGHGRTLSGHGAAHSGIGRAAFRSHAPSARGAHDALGQLVPAEAAREGWWRFVPSPRWIFSVLTLYGAFGNACVHAFRLSPVTAALVAVVPALLIERVLVKPLWNLLFHLHAEATSPLDQLVLAEGVAVVPFRNGKGMISIVRDGRSIQLAARLRADQRLLPVKVGDRLLVEEVDATNERVTVSVL